MNRSRLFCRLLYLKGLHLEHLSAYMAAIMTPGVAVGAVLGDENQAVEAVELAQQQCTSATHAEAYNAMHETCIKLHEGADACCNVYFAHNPDDRITSMVARRSAIEPFAEASATEKGLPKNSAAYKLAYNGRRLQNRYQANLITGLHL